MTSTIRRDVLYIVIRTDLGMQKGKMVAQGGHAVSGLMCRYPQQIHQINNCPKIVVRADSLEQMTAIHRRMINLDHPVHLVCDAGLTQVPPNTVTAVAVWIKMSEPPIELQELKLL